MYTQSPRHSETQKPSENSLPRTKLQALFNNLFPTTHTAWNSTFTKFNKTELAEQTQKKKI